MKDSAYDTIKECVGSLTEAEALGVLFALQAKFGWEGTMFTREDAEREWQTQQYDPETGLTPVMPMPDDAWDRVQQSWYWRKGLGEILCERGWELVSEAVAEALREDS